jgi:hypothetical protein
LIFPLDGFLAGDFPAAGFAARNFGPAGDDFNGFAGVPCDAAEVASPVCFLALLAGRVFAGGDFTDFDDPARAVSVELFLGEFLRGLLDIRLPFVAFGGSIMGIGGSCPAGCVRVVCWASLTVSEYAYKEFQTLPVRSLNALHGPVDE